MAVADPAVAELLVQPIVPEMGVAGGEAESKDGRSEDEQPLVPAAAENGGDPAENRGAGGSSDQAAGPAQTEEPAKKPDAKETAPAGFSSHKLGTNFTVSEPQLVNSTKKLESNYFKYTVEVDVKRAGWPEGKHSVSRRFNDFITLRGVLVQQNPGVIVPTLPDKENLTGMVEKFVHVSDRFTEDRRRLLEHFLNRCAENDPIMESPAMQAFCGDDDKKWDEQTKLLGKWKMPAGMRDAMQRGMSRTGIASLEGVVPEQHQGLYKYLCTVESGLTGLKKAMHAQLEDRKGIFEAFGLISASLQDVADLESEKDSVIRGDLENVGKHAKNLGSLGLEINSKEKSQILDTISYYTHMMAALRSNLYDQKALENKRAKLQKETQAAEAKRDTHTDKGDAERAEQCQATIENLAKEIEALTQQITTVGDLFSNQLVGFRRHQAQDLSQLISAFVNLRVNHAFSELTAEYDPILDPSEY
ncbi:Sorting nexin-4 [Diplonema papillatum]|nr:Sorting nexin-4 [Diplonema papillatum]